MKKIIFGTGLVILALFFPGCFCNESPVSPAGNFSTKNTNNFLTCSYSHQFSRGYHTLYPPSDELFYYKIQIADSLSSDSASFIFHFINTFRNFLQYEFRQDNRIPVQSANGKFTVKFNKKAIEDTEGIIYIKVISHGQKIKTFEMHLSFDPKAVQERNGRKGSKDGLLIRKTEVGFLEVLPEDFIPVPPPDDEKIFLQNEFGEEVQKASSETERIKIISEVIINKLEPYRGIPGNEMDSLSATQQLMELKKQNEKVYCGNIAEIFLATCLAFDIPARIIGLGNTYDDSTDPAIFHSDYHSTVEVYNKDLQCWVLIDLSFYLLEAKMEDGRILNFIDFLYLLNSPGEREKMSVSEYDPEQKKMNVVNVGKARNFGRLSDYYKQNQKFYFRHKTGFFSF